MPHPHKPQLPVQERYVLLLALLVVYAVLIWSHAASRLNGLVWDALHPLWGARPATDALIVAVDERSLAQVGRWPWPRQTQAQLVRALRAHGAERIVLDVLYTEPSDPANDTALAEAMAEGQDVILPLYVNQADQTTPMREWLPVGIFARAAAGLGHAHIQTDTDGIARGLALFHGVPEPWWPALALAAAQHAGYPLPARPGRDLPQALMARAEDYRLIPFIGPTGSIPTVSASDVLQGLLPEHYFNGKTVFVGATAPGLGDVLATPVSQEGAPMPGVEIQANVYEAWIHKRLIRPLDTRWNAALGLCWILAAVLIFPRVPPIYNLPLTLALSAGVLLSTVLGVRLGNVWIAPANTLLVVLLAYPLWSWRRLIRLNAYLATEIRRLATQPVFTHLRQPDTPGSWAQAVVELLSPRHWRLTPAPPDAPLVSQPAPHQLRVRLPDQTDTWLELTFDSEDNTHRLALQARHLERALRPVIDSTQAHTGEVLEDRIARVRQAIDAMQQMRQFIGDMIAGMPDGILVTDTLGRALYMNTKSAQWLRDDIPPGASVAHALPVSDSVSTQTWLNLLRAALVQGQPAEREVVLGNRAVLVQLSPLNLSALDLEGVVINFSDITHLHEAQQNRLETIHFISHDLRAPLASQLALLESIEAVVDSRHQSQLRHLRQLTRKSLDLADQFLQLARVEASDQLQRYPCALTDIIDNALDAMSPVARQQDVQLVLEENADDPELWVQGNADLLERALINLLSNAVKFSPSGSTVRVNVSLKGDQVQIEVIDQGPGIPPNEQARLFRRFQRTRESEAGRVPGAGLGLRFVAVVAERHEGQISVTSSAGQGSTFCLTLPRLATPAGLQLPDELA
ncbi:MAG: CHASE2 domain-containing protein [Gammaproteobacteria bacterium]|nr:MAG: CHASE2 domain-containing protein [Gammaproteobacteria bacterium]